MCSIFLGAKKSFSISALARKMLIKRSQDGLTVGHQNTHWFGLFAAFFTEGQISACVCVCVCSRSAELLV